MTFWTKLSLPFLSFILAQVIHPQHAFCNYFSFFCYYILNQILPFFFSSFYLESSAPNMHSLIISHSSAMTFFFIFSFQLKSSTPNMLSLTIFHSPAKKFCTQHSLPFFFIYFSSSRLPTTCIFRPFHVIRLQHSHHKLPFLVIIHASYSSAHKHAFYYHLSFPVPTFWA